MTFIVIGVILAAVVGGFLFAKNNPNKTKQITDTAKDVEKKVQDAVNKK